MNWGFGISLLCTLGVGLIVGNWYGYDKGGRDARAWFRAHRDNTAEIPALPRRVPGEHVRDQPAVEYDEVPTELLERVHGGLSRWRPPQDVWLRDYAGRPGRHHTDVAPGTDAQRAALALTAEYEVIGEVELDVAPIFLAIGPLPVTPVFSEPNWPSLALEAVPA